jgi:hypothetical protein
MVSETRVSSVECTATSNLLTDKTNVYSLDDATAGSIHLHRHLTGKCVT